MTCRVSPHGARHLHYMHVTTSLWGPKRFTNYSSPAAVEHGRGRAASQPRVFRRILRAAAQPMAEFYARLEHAMSAAGTGNRAGRA